MNKGSLDKAHYYVPRRLFTAQGDLIFLGAARIQRLGTGVAGQSLISGGPGADLAWGAAGVALHALSHQNGGLDEISVVGLSGLLADDQHVLDAEVLLVAAALVHAGRHENGGADEISVAALSGLLADDQHVLDAEVLAVAAALVHAARHQNGGLDEISVAGLSGLLADDQHVLDAEVLLVAAALVHQARHAKAGADPIISALDARTLAFTEQGDVVYRAAGANTLGVLPHGNAGQALLSGGHGANPSWGAGGAARVPRTIFEHAHQDEITDWPIPCATHGVIFLELPDNWNGTNKLRVKFLSGEDWSGGTQFDFTLDVGGHNEAPNTHTGSALNQNVPPVNNRYYYFDLTTQLAAVIALLSSSDTLRMTVTDDFGMTGWIIGMEIQET